MLLTCIANLRVFLQDIAKNQKGKATIICVNGVNNNDASFNVFCDQTAQYFKCDLKEIKYVLNHTAWRLGYDYLPALAVFALLLLSFCYMYGLASGGFAFVIFFVSMVSLAFTVTWLQSWRYAVELKNLINECLDCDHKDVVVVAHSHGGWVVSHLNDMERNERLVVITLGSPVELSTVPAFPYKYYQLTTTNDPITGVVSSLLPWAMLAYSAFLVFRDIRSKYAVVDGTHVSKTVWFQSHSPSTYYNALEDDMRSCSSA